jgi:hypothetical protein
MGRICRAHHIFGACYWRNWVLMACILALARRDCALECGHIWVCWDPMGASSIDDKCVVSWRGMATWLSRGHWMVDVLPKMLGLVFPVSICFVPPCWCPVDPRPLHRISWIPPPCPSCEHPLPAARSRAGRRPPFLRIIFPPCCVAGTAEGLAVEQAGSTAVTGHSVLIRHQPHYTLATGAATSIGGCRPAPAQMTDHTDIIPGVAFGSSAANTRKYGNRLRFWTFTPILGGAPA